MPVSSELRDTRHSAHHELDAEQLVHLLDRIEESLHNRAPSAEAEPSAEAVDQSTVREERKSPAETPTRRTSREWVDYFRANETTAYRGDWPARTLTDEEIAAVARSVQVFQLGESGEGRHLLRCAERYVRQSGDADYLEALKLFLYEENRHADSLGRFLDAQGLARLSNDWTDSVFRCVRRLAGLELSICVLVTAEIIAKVYYAALRTATGCEELRRLCDQILRDEVQHVFFQCQRVRLLRRSQSRFVRRFRTSLHRVFFTATRQVVWWTHRRVFRAGRYTWKRYDRRCRQEFETAARIMNAESVAVADERRDGKDRA